VEDHPGFIADARASRDRLAFVRPASAARSICSSRELPPRAGYEATHIPYRGGGEVIADICASDRFFYFLSPGTALPYLLPRRAGGAALLLSTPSASADLPDGGRHRRHRAEGRDSADLVRRIWWPSKTPRDIGENAMRPASRCWGAPAIQEILKKARRRADAADCRLRWTNLSGARSRPNRGADQCCRIKP